MVFYTWGTHTHRVGDLQMWFQDVVLLSFCSGFYATLLENCETGYGIRMVLKIILFPAKDCINSLWILMALHEEKLFVMSCVSILDKMH